MSITISNCDEICNSPVNSSKAKMLYTFSKGDRFSKRKIIMYAILHPGAIASTTRLKIPPPGPPRLASAISMTSPKSTLKFIQCSQIPLSQYLQPQV